MEKKQRISFALNRKSAIHEKKTARKKVLKRKRRFTKTNVPMRKFSVFAGSKLGLYASNKSTTKAQIYDGNEDNA